MGTKKKRINLTDDGFNSQLVENALFSGLLEFPIIRRPDQLIIPNSMIPFSKRKYTNKFSEALMFYEYDFHFQKFIDNVEELKSDIMNFPIIITPDCSVYRDMPLVLQMTNTYLNRQIGYYLQKQGCYVIPNVRRGDERSYIRIIPNEIPFAFLGIEKNSIVSIGTYGCCKTIDDKYYLKEGLRAMIKELEPDVVLVYGAMPPAIFKEFEDLTKFINYPDWTSVKHGRL